MGESFSLLPVAQTRNVMTKIKFNTWKPAFFYTPVPQGCFTVGVTITDWLIDMEQGVFTRFIGLQVMFGLGALNLGVEKNVRG